MTPRDIHIGIEQGLQAIGSNIYSNFLKKEIDLQFNTTCDKFIDWIVKPKSRNQPDSIIFEQFQFNLDDLRLLKIVDQLVATSDDIATLPDNYRNLISDSSLVRRSCFKGIKTGEVEPNIYYLNEGSLSLSYNNQTINPNEVFEGIRGITTFIAGAKDYKVTPLIQRPNRLVESEYRGDMNTNPLTKTRWDSPLSEVYSNKLDITTAKDFYVPYVIIDYIRKLVPLDSANFLVDWNTEFTDNVIRSLIDLTIKRMLFVVDSSKYGAAITEFAK